MANDYDIGDAFRAIEDELIASMIRNLDRHRAEEEKKGYNWSMWQTEQLKSLEKYKKENRRKYAGVFKNINARIEQLLQLAHEEGNMEQEISILEMIQKGFPVRRSPKGATAEFFKLNERKLNTLIKATTEDIERAEIAVLRRANDQYRKIIYNAQVYANTGAGTYEKAVDMAIKDFLKRGIDCIEYKDGSRHTISDYADMAIRTAGKRAYLQGEGQKRQEWGISTVIVNKRGNPCPKCLPHCGKVYIDDVWSGGPKDGKSPVTGITYPLISTAIEGGLYHPRCKDSHTTYFEGVSTPPTGSKYTKEELDQLANSYAAGQKQQYAKRQAEKYDRLQKYSLDPENKKQYAARAKEWENQIENMVASGIMELSRYEGVPKSWKTLDNSSGEALNAVNPRYNRLLSPFADKEEVDYNINCANCVVAYEMRRRGYDVSAKGFSENKKLSPEPWSAWKNAEIIQTNGSGLEDILEYMSKVPDGTRIQICVIWKRGTGHTFAAEKINNKTVFFDPQSGEYYKKEIFYRVEDGKTKFWRIDNLEITDRGVNACKGR